MTAILLPSGRIRYHAYIDGVYGPAVGYKLYTYAAGTTTPKTTYIDAAEDTPLTNPIQLDANGECAPYGTGAYKLELTDPDGATVDGWPQDNVYLSNSSADEEWCGTAGGTADALILSPTIGISAYQSGQRFAFVAAANNSGAVTANISGVGSLPVTKNGNTALTAGDLLMGRIYQIQYDGTRLQLFGNTGTLTTTAPGLDDDSDRVVTSGWIKDLTATADRAGISELATAAEYATGTDSARVLTPAVARAEAIVLRTAIATTSGATHDFTDIPAWVKRITVMFAGVSTNGANPWLLQMGTAGGVESSGYVGASSAIEGGVVTSSSTAGFSIRSTSAAYELSGSYTLTRISTGNTWVGEGVLASSAGPCTITSGGYKTLSGVLDRIHLTTVGGTDTFDAGSINIICE